MKIAKLTQSWDRERGSHVVAPGPCAVYELSEPLSWDRERPPASYVFVSTSTILGAPETYAFPCEPDGTVISWTELDGSAKGDVSHAAVLREMGYELVLPAGVA